MISLKKIALTGVSVGLLNFAVQQPAWSQAQINLSNQGNTAAQGNSGAAGVNGQGQAPTNFNMGGINQSPWFSNAGVRQQMGLTDAQYDQMNRAWTKAYTNYDRNVTGLDSNLSTVQRDAEMQRFQNGFYNRFGESYGTIFNDPAMQQRYNQLDLQYRGYGAFNDTRVANQLNLSDAQRSQLNRLSRDYNREMQQLRGRYATDPDGTTELFNNARTQSYEQMNSVLNPTQQQMWSDMLGQPYQFTPDVYFPQQNSNTTLKPTVN